MDSPTILTCAMLLRFSFNLEKEALTIENAVSKVLDDGWRTGDIAGSAADRAALGDKLIGTKKMGDLVVAAIGAI